MIDEQVRGRSLRASTTKAWGRSHLGGEESVRMALIKPSIATGLTVSLSSPTFKLLPIPIIFSSLHFAELIMRHYHYTHDD